MTLNEFISDYNKIIDNSDETDLVKAMMHLSTNPEYVTTTEGNHKAYNITPPVLASNRGTVKTTATVSADGTKILSINIFVPSITGSANVDISDQLTNTVAVLANSSLSSYEFQTMIETLMSDGCAYSKGVFMGYYEDSSGSTIRVAALTEESYNEIK